MNRLNALIAAFLVAAFLAACGGTTETKPEPQPAASEQAAPAPAPQVQANLTAEEPVAQAEPIPLEPSRAEVPRAERPASAPAPSPAEKRQQPAPQRPAVRTQPAPEPVPQEPAREGELEPWEPPQAPPARPRTDNEPVIVPSPPRPGQAENLPPDDNPTYPPPDDRRNVPVQTQPARVTLREGTVIEVRLEENLNSSINQNGDRFQAILERDLEADGKVVARRGDRVIGRLEDVDPGGRVKGRAEMTLLLEEIQSRENPVPLQTNRITVEAEGSVGKDAKTVGVATGIGAVIGAIAGGKKGAAIGAAIGGGAGTARVLTSRGKDAVVEREQLLSFRLERDVQVSVR